MSLRHSPLDAGQLAGTPGWLPGWHLELGLGHRQVGLAACLPQPALATQVGGPRTLSCRPVSRQHWDPRSQQRRLGVPGLCPSGLQGNAGRHFLLSGLSFLIQGKSTTMVVKTRQERASDDVRPHFRVQQTQHHKQEGLRGGPGSAASVSRTRISPR